MEREIEGYSIARREAESCLAGKYRSNHMNLEKFTQKSWEKIQEMS